MAKNSLKWLALLGGLAVGSASVALAQDSGPLIDTLVKKGILTDQEGEDLRVELLKDFGNSPAGKFNVSSNITELKISGDMRLRQQFETQTPGSNTAISNERYRTRIRFRLNGDMKLQNGWSTGFALETAAASDSGNQTLENGADDYGIFLGRAYVSYEVGDLTLVGGKQKNDFYTTDLLWDSDINPQGFFEKYVWDVSDKTSITFRAAQFIMDDNNESVSGSNGNDAWMFYQQAEINQKLGQSSSLKVAPGFLTYNLSTLAGLTNENAFNGPTAHLKVFTLPGEISFKNVGGEGTWLKPYWDIAYNMDADDRVHQVYAQPASVDEDPLAWLVGVGYGKGNGKVAGDWSIKADYREIGLGSIDPNINDSDFAFSRVNQKGFKIGGSYSINPFTTFNVTYFNTKEKESLTGAGPAVANLDSSEIWQLDLVVKF
jgi:polyhydroxyalkanoate synthesis regulator phasin